ncbi:MAG: hypothetical protein U5J62_01230 [Desulfurivibrio sp.]|nr:hypothetical protein [Desulfurivibrio sp.]
MLEGKESSNAHINEDEFEELKNNTAQIATLLGASIAKPKRWTDLHRHMHFGMLGDLEDIIEHDWPSVKAGLLKSLYGDKEPIPIDVEDLGDLVKEKPSGPVATRLRVGNLR